MPKPPLRKTHGSLGNGETDFDRFLERRRKALPAPRNKKKGVEPISRSFDGVDACGKVIEDSSWADLALEIEGIEWLKRNWLTRGMITGMVAEPKIGKSALALAGFVKPIVTGCNWFDGAAGPQPGNVCWCDTEGSASINIDRAKKYGLPLERVKLPFPDYLKPVDLEDAEHIQRLHNVILAHTVQLIVIDSLRGAHAGDENNSRIANMLNKLVELVGRTQVSSLLIHHARKIADDEELNINSFRGSNAFLALVRLQIVLDRPDAASERRRVRVLGDNLGAKGAFGFTIQDNGLAFTADVPTAPRKTNELDRAVDWLCGKMKGGKQHDASDIFEESEQFGFATRTIQRAATEKLGIEPKRVGQAWKWKMPS